MDKVMRPLRWTSLSRLGLHDKVRPRSYVDASSPTNLPESDADKPSNAGVSEETLQLLAEGKKKVHEVFPLKPETKVTLQEFIDSLPTHESPKTRPPNPTILRKHETWEETEQREAQERELYLAELSQRKGIPFVTDENYVSPLLQFFEKGEAIPSQLDNKTPHGREWRMEDLRAKDFDDLHKLYFVCLKERNLLATQAREAERRGVAWNSQHRDEYCKMSMFNIKQVLKERQVMYDRAVKAWVVKKMDKSLLPFSKKEPEEFSQKERDMLWTEDYVKQYLWNQRGYRKYRRFINRLHPLFL